MASAPDVERTYDEAASELVGAARAVLATMAEADPTLAGLEAALEVETGLRAPPHFFFTDMMTLSGRSLRTEIAGRLGGRDARRRALAARARPYLERLLATNAARAMNDLVDRVRESRRRLEADVVRLLAGATASAERAMREATDEVDADR